MKKNLLVFTTLFLMLISIATANQNDTFSVKYVNLDRKEKTYNIVIKPHEYKYGDVVIKGYQYIDSSTNKEAKIFANKGEKLTINVKNDTKTAVTNVHWHGLKVPNNQDGPNVVIKNGESHTYTFTVKESGTYWYHSHTRPVRDQVDSGMSSTFVVLDANEKSYSQDLIFVLDDVGGKIKDSQNNHDIMEVIGNIKTINGIKSDEFPPVKIVKGERIKLRFLNASTAETQTLKVNKHEFVVTHLDGAPLNKPYKTKKIELAPGQRIEAEIVANQSNEEIQNLVGSNIKLIYTNGEVPTPESPFIENKNKKLIDYKDFTPDRTIVLNSKMSHNSSNMTTWTIDNQEFPNVPPITTSKDKVYYLRIQNNDTKNMHPMDHPMHLHGGHFQIVSVNGIPPAQTEFRDTVNVPAGEYVDIAFKISEKGDWMLHCHILDHEDMGMMMKVKVE